MADPEMCSAESEGQNKPRNMSDRKERKRLRNSGQEYVSRSGKVVAAKCIPEEICQCPLKCNEKVPNDVRQKLFQQFYDLGSYSVQNAYLKEYIWLKPVRRRYITHQRVPGVSRRQLSCKYYVPISTVDEEDDLNEITIVDVCQKAFLNTYAISEKRLRTLRAKIKVLLKEPDESTLDDAAPEQISDDDDQDPASAMESSVQENKYSVISVTELKCSQPPNLRSAIPIQPKRQDSSPIDPTAGQSSLNDSTIDASLKPQLTVSSNTNAQQYQAQLLCKNTHELEKALVTVSTFFQNQLWKPEYIRK